MVERQNWESVHLRVILIPLYDLRVILIPLYDSFSVFYIKNQKQMKTWDRKIASIIETIILALKYLHIFLFDLVTVHGYQD